MAWAALVTWVITAGLGFFMLATWVSQGGARSGGTSHFQPPVVFGHFLLGAAGLVVWIIYLLNDNETLAWVAFADLVLVALIGDTLVYRWIKDRRAGVRGPLATAGTGTVSSTATGTATSAVGLAEQRIPLAAVIAHGVFAVTTIVLVLLAALEVGGS